MICLGESEYFRYNNPDEENYDDFDESDYEENLDISTTDVKPIKNSNSSPASRQECLKNKSTGIKANETSCTPDSDKTTKFLSKGFDFRLKIKS